MYGFSVHIWFLAFLSRYNNIFNRRTRERLCVSYLHRDGSTGDCGGCTPPPLALARGVQGVSNFHIEYSNIKQLSLNKFTKLY